MDWEEVLEMTIAYVSILVIVGHGNVHQMGVFAVPLFTGFILHELGHRTVARKLGFQARFQIWWEGITFAFFLWAITGFKFTFFAPGAVVVGYRMLQPGTYELRASNGEVYYAPHYMVPITPTRGEMGKIALAGPLTNIVIALISLPLYFVWPAEFIMYTIAINLFLAFFNLLPIPPLDGEKILKWKPWVWTAMFVPLMILYAVSFFGL